jgi:hypothetical protein
MRSVSISISITSGEFGNGRLDNKPSEYTYICGDKAFRKGICRHTGGTRLESKQSLISWLSFTIYPKARYWTMKTYEVVYHPLANSPWMIRCLENGSENTKAAALGFSSFESAQAEATRLASLSVGPTTLKKKSSQH